MFGGVYKLAAVKGTAAATPQDEAVRICGEDDDPLPEKVWRIYDQDGKAMADLITMADEAVENSMASRCLTRSSMEGMHYVQLTARCLSTPSMITASASTSPSLNDIRKVLQGTDQYPVGMRSSALRTPPLLCGPEPEALGYQKRTAQKLS